MRRAIMFIVAASAVWAQAAQAQKADAPLLPAGVTALDPTSGPATDRYRFQSKKAEKPFIIYVTPGRQRGLFRTDVSGRQTAGRLRDRRRSRP